MSVLLATRMLEPAYNIVSITAFVPPTVFAETYSRQSRVWLASDTVGK